MKDHLNHASLLLASVLIATMPLAGTAQEQEPRPSALRGEVPADLRALTAQGLKLQGPRVVFDGKFSFPPKLKGFAQESNLQLEIKPSARPAVRDAREKLRAVAIENPRIKELLGERFSLLSSGWLEPEKKGDDRAEIAENTSADRYQLMFYSYRRNQIVTAVTNNAGELLDVATASPKVQPPESHEEVEAAANIVRSDERHAAGVKGLRARGIQTEGKGENRYLYVTFYKEASKRAAYEATVDMTAGKVVSARPIRAAK